MNLCVKQWNGTDIFWIRVEAFHTPPHVKSSFGNFWFILFSDSQSSWTTFILYNGIASLASHGCANCKEFRFLLPLTVFCVYCQKKRPVLNKEIHDAAYPEKTSNGEDAELMGCESTRCIWVQSTKYFESTGPELAYQGKKKHRLRLEHWVVFGNVKGLARALRRRKGHCCKQVLKAWKDEQVSSVIFLEN